MKLSLLCEEKYKFTFDDAEITAITDDSRKITKGCLFFCIKGGSFDGHDFAAKAIENGAAAVVCERDTGIDRQIIVENSRTAYGEFCAAWFGHPEKRMKLVGVTGTNGKTTVTTLIKKILTNAGHRVGLIGTIQNEIGEKVIHAEKTTPLTFDYFALLNEMADEGCDYVVMEVSSFALSQNRIGPSFYTAAAFTNLTQDHLDYHKTMEDYFRAKKLLFSVCGTAIVSVDDDYGKKLFKDLSCEKYSTSITEKADFYAENIRLEAGRTEYDFSFGESCEKIHADIAMAGRFNVANTLQAAAVCLKLGISDEVIFRTLGGCGGVKGRCEVIPTGRDFTVICDYAHTPDAVENILSSVKECTSGRLICLFGCGGNRDSDKRPKMAHAAEKYADLLYITSDNPRNEEPMNIIDEILGGLTTDILKKVICDRREAIYDAVKNARSGDVIVLAGKGHEDYQIRKDGEVIHFDEREVVADALRQL